MKTPSTRRALAATLTLSIGIVVGSLAGGVAVAHHQLSDVGNSNQFHDEIDWLVDSGIATGFPDGTFRPNQPVTRQAMAAFLARQSAGLRLVSKTTDPGQSSAWFESVECGVGEHAIAGGGSMDFSETFLTDSEPSQPGNQHSNGWTVAFESDGNAQLNPTQLRVWALCVPIPFAED